MHPEDLPKHALGILAKFKAQREKLTRLKIEEVPDADIDAWLGTRTKTEKQTILGGLRAKLNNKQDPHLLFRIALMYHKLSDKNNYKYWLKKAVAAKHAAACIEYACLLSLEKTEIQQAEMLFEQNKATFPKAYHCQALFLPPKNCDIRSLLNLGVKQNCQYALTRRGHSYLLGRDGYPKNIELALDDLVLAAENGNVTALCILGGELLYQHEARELAQQFLHAAIKESHSFYALSDSYKFYETRDSLKAARYACYVACNLRNYAAHDNEAIQYGPKKEAFDRFRANAPATYHLAINFYQAIALQDKNLFLSCAQENLALLIDWLENPDSDSEVAPLYRETLQEHCYAMIAIVLPELDSNDQTYKLRALLGLNCLQQNNIRMPPCFTELNPRQNLAMGNYFLTYKPSDKKADCKDDKHDETYGPGDAKAQPSNHDTLFKGIMNRDKLPKRESKDSKECTEHKDDGFKKPEVNRLFALYFFAAPAQREMDEKASAKTLTETSGESIELEREVKAFNLIQEMLVTLQPIPYRSLVAIYPFSVQPLNHIAFYNTKVTAILRILKNLDPVELAHLVCQYAFETTDFDNCNVGTIEIEDCNNGEPTPRFVMK